MHRMPWCGAVPINRSISGYPAICLPVQATMHHSPYSLQYLSTKLSWEIQWCRFASLGKHASLAPSFAVLFNKSILGNPVVHVGQFRQRCITRPILFSAFLQNHLWKSSGACWRLGITRTIVCSAFQQKYLGRSSGACLPVQAKMHHWHYCLQWLLLKVSREIQWRMVASLQQASMHHSQPGFAVPSAKLSWQLQWCVLACSKMHHLHYCCAAPLSKSMSGNPVVHVCLLLIGKTPSCGAVIFHKSILGNPVVHVCLFRKGCLGKCNVACLFFL